MILPQYTALIEEGSTIAEENMLVRRAGDKVGILDLFTDLKLKLLSTAFVPVNMYIKLLRMIVKIFSSVQVGGLFCQ